MSDRTYPPMPGNLFTLLEAVRLQMEFDPEYLWVDQCPYPENLKRLLKNLVAPAHAARDDMVTAVFKTEQKPEEQLDSLIDEVKAAINSMKQLKLDMDKDDVDVSDRLNFHKNYGGMIERFLGLLEKAQGMKQMYQFQNIVIQTMSQVMDKDQVFEFKGKLRGIIEMEE